MTETKYIICAEISYSFLRQRHQIFADLLSKTFKVEFIERIPSRLPSDILKRIIRKTLKIRPSTTSFQSPPDEVKVCRSYLLPDINLLFRLYNKYRAGKILKNANKGDIVHLFANNATFASQAKVANCFLVFDIIHNWWSFPYHTKKQNLNLKKIIAIADLIVSDSKATLELAQNMSYQRTTKFLFLPPGVDPLWLHSPKKAPKFRSPNYELAFFGNLRANSDLNIFDKLARSEDTNLTIYGLLDPSLQKKCLEGLRKHYLGQFEMDSLIEKVRNADAVLLPYDKSSLSKTIFPAKYFEVMALGKPIISDSKMIHLPLWSEVIWESDDLIRLGWENLLHKHYQTRAAKQITLATQNTWEERVSNLKKVINDRL